ncbi:hypothetical protein TEA_007790 [Camellia sinensis var. sinensis]|uniref:Uncharacterized protein n=1 Tax=Camellia sinensis var. sinensis TaxID=542762 RepID=A0A4S4EEK1_CAMSN|nr:hypothetical protein TEA_007790 [Camellia sinensis var. sinensis]
MSRFHLHTEMNHHTDYSVKSSQQLQLELQKHILDIQQQNQQHCEQEIEEIKRGIKSGNITPDASNIRFSDEVLDEQKHARIADEKVALAVQAYELRLKYLSGYLVPEFPFDSTQQALTLFSVEESEMDSEESDVSGSDGDDTSRISWFCNFQVPYDDYALDLILDVESSHGKYFNMFKSNYFQTKVSERRTERREDEAWPISSAKLRWPISSPCRRHDRSPWLIFSAKLCSSFLVVFFTTFQGSFRASKQTKSKAFYGIGFAVVFPFIGNVYPIGFWKCNLDGYVFVYDCLILSFLEDFSS